MDANQGMGRPMAGTAYNIPDTERKGSASWRSEYYEPPRPELWEAPGIPDARQVPTPQPPPKMGLETADITPEGIVYPEGWNPAQTLASMEHISMDFLGDFYSGYYTEYGGLGAEPPRVWGGQPAADAAMYGTPTEILPEIPGIPSYHAWTKDETGAWGKQEPGAVFDALYEANGIDPNDPEMVQWFWSFADEDLLGVGVLFDVIDWGGTGGYGGRTGYEAPYELGTPSRQYGAGQKPVRGNYSSYLSLTSWRI